MKRFAENQDKVLEKVENLQKVIHDHKENQDDSITEIKELINSRENDQYADKVTPAGHANNPGDKTHDKKITEEIHPSDKKGWVDNFILSDSILQRINTTRFSSNELTLKRYIRGGAKTCLEYMETTGHKIPSPKRVLLHIGARDLHENGVKEQEYKELFNCITKSWPDSDIYVLPILKRKDVPNSEIELANRRILEASKGYNLTVLRSFNPSEDMYFDNAHLNTHKGIPAIVRFLKSAMNIQMPTLGRMTPPSLTEVKPKFSNRNPSNNIYTQNNNNPGPMRGPMLSTAPPYPTNSLHQAVPSFPPHNMQMPQYPHNTPMMPPLPPFPFYPWMWNPFNPQAQRT